MSQQPSNRPATVHKLTLALQHKLNNYVIEHYSAAKLTDPEFAVKAEQELGFKVTSGNIQGVRQAFDIQSTRAAMAEEAAEPKTRLDRMEKDIEELKSQLSNLMQQLGVK